MSITKVSGGILDPGINVAGIVTATGFDGPFTGGSSKNITAGILTATGLDINGNGDISGNLVVGGNLTANGDFTTLNTTLREVELLRVDANNDNVAAGIITQTGAGDILRLYDGSTQVVTVLDTGEVGIGTVSPSSLLEVASDSPKISLTDTDNNSEIYLHNVGGAAVLNAANSDIVFQTPLQELFRIQSTGNTGIGTFTPRTILHLHDSADTRIQFTDDGTGAASSDGVIAGLNGDDDFFINNRESGKGLKFFTGSDDLRLHINSVGITSVQGQDDQDNFIINVDNTEFVVHTDTADGEVSLRARDGSGNNYAKYMTFFTQKSGDAAAEKVRIAENGQVCIGEGFVGGGGQLTIRGLGVNSYAVTDYQYIGTPANNTTTLAQIRFTANTTGSSVIQGAVIKAMSDNAWSASGDAPTRLEFHTAPDGSASMKNRLTIFGDGSMTQNYGNPDASATFRISKSGSGVAELRFDTAESNTASFFLGTDEQLRLRYGATEHIRFSSDGRVGIGSTQPSNTLVIQEQTDNNPSIQLFRHSTGGDIANVVWKTNSGSQASINYRGGGGSEGMQFYTGGTASSNLSMVIKPDGKVAIGTHTPQSYKFEIWDDTIATLQIRKADSSRIVFSNDSQHNTLYSQTISGYGDRDFAVRIGQNERLRITGVGITVTGEVAASQDYPNFRPTLDFNFAAERKLDPRITYSRTGPASFVNEFGEVVLVGDNAPRFDYDLDTGECKGLLIEEERTNYVRQSLTLESEWIAGTGSFAVDNSITNPDGSVGAYYHTGGELYHQDIDLSAAGTNVVTVSLWVKERSGQSGNLDIQIYQQISGSVVDLGGFSFNPATEAISLTSNYSNGTVEEYPNGWYRVSAKLTTASGNFTSSTRYDMQNAEHYVWGMQLEVGEFPTSFIPTRGAISTRGVDITRIDGDEFTEFYNDNEWTMITDTNVDNSQALVASPSAVNSINFEGDNNTKKFQTRYVTSSTDNQGYVDVIGAMSGTTYFDLTGATVGTYNVKTALAAKVNDVAVSHNGETVQSDTTVTMLEGGRAMHIGENPKQFHIKRIMYYPKRLPNSQLVTLTS